ncbi:hypothetical protein AURDEDRAFT_189109 [Auricularia subglabra TFB-10046 SS5]|uniref:Uncharacterized protein n=1 Tax=Auricularia subglabra (strain TFB-10046 / SS5) TaxID=717982 RepID=J0D2U4_AURST|nr:hypothetical protein AURDEDRAFT_189109 [Auricularia subglabra TFB-10046 SS5]
MSASKRIKTVSTTLLARYPKRRCGKHPDVHCYENPETGDHFDIGLPTRLTVYTAAILKGEATFTKAPSNKHFGHAFALSGRGRTRGTGPGAGHDDGDDGDDGDDDPPRRRAASPARRAADRASSPIPAVARDMPLSAYAQFGGFDEEITVKLAAIGHTPATKVRHIPRRTWEAAGMSGIEFITASEVDAQTRKRMRIAAPSDD